MSANVRIVPRNFHDEATVTASEAAPNFPVANTQNVGRDAAWRSTTTGTVTVSGSFSRSRVVNFFGMFRHRNHGANIRVQLFTDNAWSSAASDGDTGTVAVNKVVGSAGDTDYAWGDDPYGVGQYDPLIAFSTYWFDFGAAGITIQSYRITLSGHSTTFWNDAFWHVSRFWLGKYFEVNINASYGASIGIGDATESDRTRGGSLISNSASFWKTAKMTFNSVREAELPVWLDIMADAKRNRDIVTWMFPGDGTRKERDAIFAGKFSALDVLGFQVNRLEKNFSVEET